MKKKKNRKWLIVVLFIFFIGISLSLIKFFNVDLPFEIKWTGGVVTHPPSICDDVSVEDICVRCVKEDTKYKCSFELIEENDWYVESGDENYYCSPTSAFEDGKEKTFICSNEDCLNDVYNEVKKCTGSYGQAYKIEQLYVKDEDMQRIKEGIELDSGEYKLYITGGTERFHKLKFYVDLCDDSDGIYCVQIRMEGRKGVFPESCSITDNIGFGTSEEVTLVPGVREVFLKVNTPTKLKVCDVYAEGIYLWD